MRSALVEREAEELDIQTVQAAFPDNLRSAVTARENPFRSLMSMAMVPNVPVISSAVSSIGTYLTANIVSVAADGRLRYSVRPQMGWNALRLNSWLAVAQ